VPELDFKALGAKAVEFAAGPCLALELEVANRVEGEEITSLALQCQLRIVPPSRRYTPQEQEGLTELFGEPSRWGRSMPPSFLWTHCQKVVPAFTGRTQVELLVPCTWDFNVGATKYFHAIIEGEVPLLLLFSGTVFFRGVDDALTVWPVPWAKEAAFRLPVEVWKKTVEHYHPNSAVLRLRSDVFDRLYSLKRARGLATFDEALELLLGGAA